MNFKIGGIAAAFGFVFSLIIGLASGNGAFALVRALTFAVFFFILVNMFLIVIHRYIPELLSFEPESGDDSRPGSRVNIIEVDGAASILGGEAGLESLDSPQGGGDSAQPDLSSERFSVDGDYGGGSDGFGGATGVPGDLGGNSGPDIPSLNPALDQMREDSYNEKGSITGAPGPAAGIPGSRGREAPARPVSRGDAALPGDASSVDVLPDFEAMSQAFLASTQEAEKGETESESESEDETIGQTDDVFQLSVSGQSPDPASQYYTGNKPVELEGDFPPKRIAQAIQTVLKRDEQ